MASKLENCTLLIELLKSKNISRLDVPFECEKYPLAFEIFLGIILSIIVIGAIGGNFLVILAVLLVHRLRTPSNILIVNLAASDLLVSLIIMPLMVFSQINRFRWIFKESFCDLYLSIDVLLCTSSILNLCAISIDRYLAITRPMSYTKRRTNKLMAGYILITWVISFLISVPPVFGWKEPFVAGVCEYSNNLYYQVYATFGAFYIPLIIMIVLYIRIFKLASEMAKKDQQRFAGFTTDEDNANVNTSNHNLALKTVSGGSGGAGSISRANGEEESRLLNSASTSRQKVVRKKPKSSSESKAIRTLGVIMGCFTLCWLPFFIIQLCKPILKVSGVDSDNVMPSWLFELFLWLGYLNSFLNPIIYAKFNRDFRNPFKKILVCHCHSINERIRSDIYAEQYGQHQQTQQSQYNTESNRGHHHHSNKRSNRRRSSDPFTYVSKKNRRSNHSSAMANNNSHLSIND